MIEYDELVALIQKAANISNKYSVPRLGLVTKELNSTQQFRFVVQIPSLGWDTDDKAVKCNVCDTKGYTAPVVGEYVIVQFVDGNLNFPIITGSANYMKDMVTKSRDVGTDVLYEQPGNIKISYDGDQLSIGNKLFKAAARDGDTTTSSTTEDAAFWLWLAGAGSILAGLGLVAPVPTSLTGKINSGSNQVQIGDK